MKQGVAKDTAELCSAEAHCFHIDITRITAFIHHNRGKIWEKKWRKMNRAPTSFEAEFVQ
jgi:hypothetical protein